MYKQLQQRDLAEAPVNVSALRAMKDRGEPIACLTASMRALLTWLTVPVRISCWSVIRWAW